MGAVRVWNEARDPKGALAGTLTGVACLADDPSRLYAIGSAHVLAPIADRHSPLAPAPGDPIACQMDDGVGKRVIGRLFEWSALQPVTTGFANRMDAALVEIDAQTAAVLVRALDQPLAVAGPVAGAAVRLRGMSGGEASGRVIDGLEPLRISYPTAGGGVADLELVDLSSAAMQARSGDSGALLTSGAAAIGILVSTSVADRRCHFYRLDGLLDQFHLRWFSPPAPGAVTAARREFVALPDAVVLDRERSRDVLARTLWGEARGEPIAGLRAVAAIVLNRARHRRVRWWGTDIVGVCLCRAQFSCWNADDPNLPQLRAVTDGDARFRTCRDVAESALGGEPMDEAVGVATHYHTRSVSPGWASGKRPCTEIGNHLFYDDIEPA